MRIHVGRGFLLVLIATGVQAGGPVAHALLDTTPPPVAITTAWGVTATQTVAFGETVTGVSAENVVVQHAATSQAVATTLVCRNAGGGVVSCSSTTIRSVLIRPASPWIPGRLYVVVVNPDGALPVVDLAGNPASKTTRQFYASFGEQEASPAAAYRWHSVIDGAAYGGSYWNEHLAGASATFRFTGTSVTWYTRLGPGEGRANVFIDGVLRTVVNNYSAQVRLPYPRRFDGLSNGYHILTIQARDEAGARGGGRWVAIDAFRIGTGPVWAGEPVFGWRRVNTSSAGGGRFVETDVGGASVTFPFGGGGIDWFTVAGPNRGKAAMYVDGRLIRTVDTYSPTTRYGVRYSVSGLADGLHSLRIVVLWSRNAASRGRFVAVDRWVLRAGISMFRHFGTWIDLFDYNASTADSVIDDRIADMKARGVRTLYLQTGRYITAAFAYPAQVGRWIEQAHANGIAVVGWYLPAYSEYVDGDVTKTAAIASYRSPAGQRFDGLGIDIEYRAKTSSKTEFFTGITQHLARVRSAVGVVFPVAAITFPPLDMDLWPAGWGGFPWSSVNAYANVAMPMSYWSNRLGRCADGQTAYCAYQYTKTNVERTRAYTGLPVHVIGGVGDRITQPQTADFVRAARDAKAYGGSLYDYRTTSSTLWPTLAGLNTL